MAFIGPVGMFDNDSVCVSMYVLIILLSVNHLFAKLWACTRAKLNWIYDLFIHYAFTL